MYSGNGKVVSIRFNRIIIQETGTFNPQVARSYVTVADENNVSAIARAVAESGNGGRVTATAIGNLASSFIEPSSTHEGQVAIANGWGERRCRFFIEAHVSMQVGAEVIMHIQGYTDGMGISLGDNVDPSMRFYVNSIASVRKTTFQTPVGQSYNSTIYDNNHLVCNPDYRGVYSNDASNQYMMRPQDVFGSIQISHLDMEMGRDNTYDTRSAVTDSASFSRRTNSLPAYYSANVINSYDTARKMAEDPNNAALYSEALSASQAGEGYASTNAFIQAMSNFDPSGTTTSSFRFKDLISMDSNALHVTRPIRLDHSAVAKVHQAGQTREWTGGDLTTIVATTLSHSVSALIMEQMLSRIILKCTNHTVDGQPVTEIMHAVPLASEMDIRQGVEAFVVRFEYLVINPATKGNQLGFKLEMDVDLYGQTKIAIQIGDDPYSEFVTPSFCDSLILPVLTGDPRNLSNVANDYENLISYINEERGQGANRIITTANYASVI